MATKTFRSLIHKYFSKELIMKLDRLSRKYDIDNNTKSEQIDALLEEYNVPFTTLGNGTNRYGILIDGYVFKIALDKAGKIDNKREFKYSIRMQPYVIKVYETNKEGLLMVCEYVTIFSLADFYDNQEQMREILADISKSYMIGDMGVTSENYYNWGFRSNGSICILDFAYIYALSYKTFTCECSDEAMLEYDANYVNLICPRCNKKYTFSDIRRTITKQAETEEIGDIMQLGYVLKEEAQELEVDPSKSVSDIVNKESTREDSNKKSKNRPVRRKRERQNFDLDPCEQERVLFESYNEVN